MQNRFFVEKNRQILMGIGVFLTIFDLKNNYLKRVKHPKPIDHRNFT